MLLATFPDNCQEERRWISSVVLGEFLGLHHVVQFDRGETVRLQADGKTLQLGDDFFAQARNAWLTKETVPGKPLARWNMGPDGPLPEAGTTSLPVLFGGAGFHTHGNGNAVLDLDIFGSAFFMLSRYEEAVVSERDPYDRFPANASLAFSEGFLNRPVIDEYVEILWAAMGRLWPQMKRKVRHFRSVVTCDVDHPYHPSAVSLRRLLRRTAGEALRKRSLVGAVNPVRNYIASRTGNWKSDPYYYTVDWMMNVNERAGNKLAFYFIPEITDTLRDDTCLINDPAVTSMMKRIDSRGHEIGIHPGYNTFRNRDRVISGKHTLQGILDRENIRQNVRGGRQHYLRWGTETPANWDAAGLAYDSTLGYADHAGFRCGTCHEYTMFDLHHRRPLSLKQRPLICMESTVADYMGYGYTDSALEKMKALKDEVKRFNGNFTLSWHNSSFESFRAKAIYCEVIT